MLPPDYNRAYMLRANGFDLTVLPSVFHPKWHFTSLFFARVCEGLLGREQTTVLDIGTGTGLAALSAARRATRVVATDINPAAVRCAKINTITNRMADKIEVYEGDMFAPVQGQTFDLIICNPPYFRGVPHTEAQLAYLGGPELERISRMARGAHAYLNRGGKLACVLGDAADVPAIIRLIEEFGWVGRVVARRSVFIEEITVWEFSER